MVSAAETGQSEYDRQRGRRTSKRPVSLSLIVLERDSLTRKPLGDVPRCRFVSVMERQAAGRYIPQQQCRQVSAPTIQGGNLNGKLMDLPPSPLLTGAAGQRGASEPQRV